MVRVCDFPGCRNKNLSDSPYVFHRLPVVDLPLRQLWLLSMGLNIETRLEKVKRLRVCSAHFGKDDYVPARPEHRKKNVLRSDAVPGFQQLPGTSFWNTETGPELSSWDAVEEKPLLIHNASYENTHQHQPISYEKTGITEEQSIKKEATKDSSMPLDQVVLISDDDDDEVEMQLRVEDKVKAGETDSTMRTTEEHEMPHERTRTEESKAVAEEDGQESRLCRDNLLDRMTRIEKSKPVIEEDGQKNRFCRNDLWRFIKKYCCDGDMNVSSELFVTTEVIQACALHPFCIYLFVGVKFINGQRLSLVLIGYYDQNREVSVVRPLGSLQLSYDSISPHASTDWHNHAAESDSHLLIQMLNMSGLNLNNLAVFYSDAPKLKTMVSMLRGINPSLISLCRIPKMAARACQVGISASFACVMDLLKDLHQHFSDCSNWGNTLDTLYANLASFNPAHPIAQQCLLVICIVSKMPGSWGEMLDYFKTLPPTEQTQRIQAQLMDAKIQLHFLFLCHALEPLQTLLEIQQSGNFSLDAELQQASILVHFYACSIFQPSEIKSFIGRRSLMALSMDNKLLPVTDVSIGFRAFAFLSKTSTVDLPEEERSNFYKNAMVFYRTMLKTLSKSIPEQLGDTALKIIGNTLKHTNISDIPGPVMSELAVQLGLVSHGSQEALQLPHKHEKFLSILLSKFGPETCSWAKSLCVAKKYPSLHNLLLSILVMPRSLRKKKILAQVVFKPDALSSSSEAATVSSGQLKMNRDMPPDQPSVSRVTLTTASPFDHIKTEKESESDSSETERSFEMEESDDTDNSLDVVYITEKSAFSETSMFQSPTLKFEGIGYVAPIEEDEETFFTPPLLNLGGQNYNYLEGELVLGDMGSPPLWPGVVALSRKEDEPPEKKTVWVEWYGQTMMSQVSELELRPFGTFSQYFCTISFSTDVIYKEAVFLSLQEAAWRCQKQFPAGPDKKDKLMKQMMDWALGGFQPTGPVGFKPTTSKNETGCLETKVSESD